VRASRGRILVVAAVDAELGDLPGAALGVGVVRAAATMGRLLALIAHRSAYEGVLLVGSCGVYGDAFSVGTAVRARRMGLADGGAALGLSYAPLAPEPVVADAALSRLLDTAPADVLTVGAISTDPALVAKVGAGWQVEHLECFGAAWACAQAGVPFAAVLGVANRVGPDAHAEWKANRLAAEEAARAVVRGALGGLADGL